MVEAHARTNNGGSEDIWRELKEILERVYTNRGLKIVLVN